MPVRPGWLCEDACEKVGEREGEDVSRVCGRVRGCVDCVECEKENERV